MAWAAAAGAAGVGLSGLAGTLGSAAWSAKEAEKQRRWQEDMMSNAYQRTARDLEAAGLNRILALGPGPVGAPSGAMPHIADMGHSISSGVETGARVSKIPTEQKLLAAQKSLANSAEQLNKAGTDEAIQRKFTSLAQENAAYADMGVKRATQQLLLNQLPEQQRIGEFYSGPYGKIAVGAREGARAAGETIGAIGSALNPFRKRGGGINIYK